MNRLAFIASLAVLPVAACAGSAFARHETVDITTRVVMTGADKGKLSLSVEGNFSEASAVFEAFKASALPGDTMTVRFNGEVLGVFVA